MFLYVCGDIVCFCSRSVLYTTGEPELSYEGGSSLPCMNQKTQDEEVVQKRTQERRASRIPLQLASSRMKKEEREPPGVK